MWTESTDKPRCEERSRRTLWEDLRCDQLLRLERARWNDWSETETQIVKVHTRSRKQHLKLGDLLWRRKRGLRRGERTWWACLESDRYNSAPPVEFRSKQTESSSANRGAPFRLRYKSDTPLIYRNYLISFYFICLCGLNLTSNPKILRPSFHTWSSLWSKCCHEYFPTKHQSHS